MKLRSRQQSGQGMTEFVIVTPVMLLLVLGALQFTFIYNAKSVLTYATFMAARAGALNNADPQQKAYALAAHHAALYAASPDSSAMMQARACVIDEINAGAVQLEILNPTVAEFSESYATDLDGFDAIPNDNLMYRNPNNAVPIQDANLLKIRVTYCHRMIVPFVDQTILTLLSLAPVSDPGVPHINRLGQFVGGAEAQNMLAGGGFRAVCLQTFNRLPISAEATIRMQSPAILTTDPINLTTPITNKCGRDLGPPFPAPGP